MRIQSSTVKANDPNKGIHTHSVSGGYNRSKNGQSLLFLWYGCGYIQEWLLLSSMKVFGTRSLQTNFLPQRNKTAALGRVCLCSVGNTSREAQSAVITRGSKLPNAENLGHPGRIETFFLANLIREYTIFKTLVTGTLRAGTRHVFG